MRQRVEAAVQAKKAGIEKYQQATADLKKEVKKLQKALDAGLYDGLD